MNPLWIAFWCFLYLQPTAAQQTEDCLVAVSNRTDGTSIILDCAPDTSTAYDTLLQDQYLSPLIRSPSVLVTHNVNTTATNKSIFAVFLPLSNSLGILELTYNKTSRWAHNLTIIATDCKTISVHNVRGTYFTACLNSNEKLVMHRLYINNTHLDASYGRQFRDYISVSVGTNFSNIVYAALQNGQSFQRLYVAVGTRIHSITPFDQHITNLRGRLPSDNCHTLEYAGHWVLLATCTDSSETYSVYYDISGGSVLNTTQGTGTVPILCPHFEGQLTVNTTHGVVLYRNWSSNANTEFKLYGIIHSGVCFGDSKMASLSFAYSNTEAGVYAVNISHGAENSVHLSSSACLKQNCQPVFTLGQYLLIQEQNSDSTVITQARDPKNEYSTVLEVKSDVSGVALVHYPRVDNNDPHVETSNAAVISISTVGAVLLLLLLLGLGGIFLYHRCRKPKSHHYEINDRVWFHDHSPMLIRQEQKEVVESSRGEPCPNASRPATQGSDATGGSLTAVGSLTTGSNETMPPIDCTEPPDRSLSQGQIAPEGDWTPVTPVQESRLPVIQDLTRPWDSGDGAEDHHHPHHDPQTN